MKAPRFATVSLSLDTERYRSTRPEARQGSIFYLIDRLLGGETIAESELEHYGIKVSVREALSPEIIK